MLKTISAALVAASMLAAPAMAATVIKTERGPVTKTVVVKPSVANARAETIVVKKAGHHHRKYIRHHRAHKHMGAVVTKKVVVKRVSDNGPKVKHVIVKKKI